MLYMDGVADWDNPSAQAHRILCASCRSELQAAQWIVDLSRKNGDPPPVDPLQTERILNQVAGDRRRRRFVRWTGVGSFVGVAAAVLILLVPALFRPPVQPVPQPAPELARTTQPNPPPATLEDARVQLAEFTRKTIETLPKVPDVTPPRMNWPAKNDDPLSDTGAVAAKSVQPITTTARKAFSAFLKTAQVANIREMP